MNVQLYGAQGIDLVAGGRNKKTKRTAPKSDNPYLKLLVKVTRSTVQRLRAKLSAIVSQVLRTAGAEGRNQ